jgi:hypothetical protein
LRDVIAEHYSRVIELLRGIIVRTYLIILERAWSANFKMVWYVLMHDVVISAIHIIFFTKPAAVSKVDFY